MTQLRPSTITVRSLGRQYGLRNGRVVNIIRRLLRKQAPYTFSEGEPDLERLREALAQAAKEASE